MTPNLSLRELQKESRTVFILGAGASAGIGQGQETGVPLMRDFLDVAYELYRTHTDLEYADSFEVVFNALKDLQGIYAKALIDLRNVESAFAAFEMMELFEKDPKSKVKTYADHMRNLIITTVTETTRFSLKDGKLVSQPPYEDFVRLLINKLVTDMKRKCAIITFNYDLAVDVALANWKIPFHYCLNPDENTDGIPLLKLHGSLNWKKCANADECDKIHIVDVPSTMPQPHCQIKSPWHPGITYRPFQATNLTTPCNHGIKSVPIIVPPTWNKNKHYKEIEGVWQAAQNELKFAENIVVCGYSLPETDMFFRYLFALGTFGDVRLKRLLVCNPDGVNPPHRGEVEERFRSMLGRISEDRFEFKNGSEGRFDQCIPHVHGLINENKW